MPRVAVIIVDAVELSVMEQLMTDGHLPNLRQLAARSARFGLESPLPYRSEMVWTRFLTGKDSEALKYWSQLRFEPKTYETWMIGACDRPPFFSNAMPGKKVIAFDLIHSSLHPVNGVHVTAWGSHSPKFPRASYPAGLLTEIDRRFGVNPAFDNDFDIGWFEPDYIDNLAEAAKIGTRRRTEILRWLMERDPDWDLLVTCISEVHSGGHHFWHGIDERHLLHGRVPTSERAGTRMVEIFEEVDRSVGELLDAFPEDTTVVVAAMHGMKPADDVVSNAALPELFARHQLGRQMLADPDQQAWKKAGYPPIVPERHASWYSMMRRRFTDGPLDRLRHVLEDSPPLLRNALRRLAGKTPERKLGPMYATTPAEQRVSSPKFPLRKQGRMGVVDWYRNQWPKMRWFATPTFGDGHVRLNVAGREGQGLVAPSDFIAVRDEVIRFLSACTDPRTGKPAVKEVIPVHPSDPLDRCGPDADLIVIFADSFDSLEHPDVGIVGPYPHLRTGSHSNVGWAMIAGKGIDAGDRGNSDARNLTATVLELAGCAIPDSIDGKPLLVRETCAPSHQDPDRVPAAAANA